MINFILCGGSGTRLWPVSRTSLPKQFVKLFNNKSLFQKTLERNLKLCNRVVVISNETQYFLAKDQYDEVVKKSSDDIFILESVARNTAPAVALSCMECDENEIILVTPSDHLVKNESNYEKVFKRANELAQEGYIVTFGIKPEYAETGYGYIEANGESVVSFREKPVYQTACEYLEKGNYYWNSGMFVFKAGVFLEELKKHEPEMYEACKIALRKRNGNIVRIDYDSMMKIPSNSIDYAVMEKTNKAKVVFADISWNDLGSFDSLYKELEKTDNGDTKAKNLITIGTKNNLFLTNSRLVTAVDVEDLVVVDTHDAVFIANKKSSQKVKNLVENLKKTDPDICDFHTTVYRPWGKYTVLENGYRYKIKSIEVKPGHSLSLQKHIHRNEHWVVVRGTAKVTVGGEVKLVRANESTYINMGEPHRLENPGKIPLVIIEVQVGEYLNEDDIIRIEDDYDRDILSC